MPTDQGRTFGEQPRPRVLDWTQDESLGAELKRDFPTYRKASPFEVHQADWDLVVVDGSLGERGGHLGGEAPSPHLYTVSFSGPIGTNLINPAHKPITTSIDIGVSWQPSGTRSERLVVPNDLDPELAVLVEADLLPAMGPPDRPVLTVDENVLQLALLRTGADELLAAAYYRFSDFVPGLSNPGNPSEAVIGWVLPGNIKRRGDWVRLASRLWRERDPERFLDLPGWDRTPDWTTSAERSIAGELEELNAREVIVLREIAQAREDLKTELEAARQAAATGVRRLLTARSDELEDATAAALTTLGFEVQRMDPTARAGDRREDLRVSDPAVPGWIAVVEVRAHRGGAAVSDLAKLQRWAILYTADAGKVPDALWYVVSQFVGRDPSSRQRPLESNPDDRVALAEADGLALDTGYLFRLVQAVAAGDVRPEQARVLLRHSTGALGPLDPLPHAFDSEGEAGEDPDRSSLASEGAETTAD